MATAKRRFFILLLFKILMLALPIGQAAEAGQQSEPAAFDVSSVKASPTCAPQSRPILSHGRLNLPCSSVRSMLQMALGISKTGELAPHGVSVVGGPPWLESERFEVLATTDKEVTVAHMLGPMLLKLLEDRFRVVVHWEPRELPVYDLTVGKKGPKFHRAEEGSCIPKAPLSDPPPTALGLPQPKYCGGGSSKVANGSMITDWYSVTIAEFAESCLESEVHRPVFDKTGLKGRFDIHLEYAMDLNGRPGSLQLNGNRASDLPPLDDSAAPSVFTAVQKQLGLRLSESKGQIMVLFVDHVEKPAPN